MFKYFLLTFFLITLATQTLSLGVKDVDTKKNVRHFDYVGNGEACDTDEKNEEELEHGIMCIEGLECHSHGDQKMCMERHDDTNSGSSTLSFSFIVLVMLMMSSLLYN